jgi:hypothetical protein
LVGWLVRSLIRSTQAHHTLLHQHVINVHNGENQKFDAMPCLSQDSLNVASYLFRCEENADDN